MSSGPGSSSSGSFAATMASMRLPASTSFTSWIERCWPIASGVRVSGNGTLSRSGRIGSVSGRLVRTSAVAASPSDEGMWMLTAAVRRSARAATLWSGRASGISTSRMPSSYEAFACSAATSAPSSTSRLNGPCSISICW